MLEVQMIENIKALRMLIDKIGADNGANITDNDHSFLHRNFRDGLEKYIDRLKAIGFINNQKVLDAGCGYGQWSLALAGLNEMVESCDISHQRVQFLQELALRLGIRNISARVSAIDAMSYPASYFDAVFCYGVIFLTPWRKSLASLARVLKPGGSLYLNANGLGWYLFLWKQEHNKAEDYDPKAVVAHTFTDTLRYDRQKEYRQGANLIIEPENLKTALESLGFSNIRIASEGSLHPNSAAKPPTPFFSGSYGGELGVYEVLAQKSS